MKPDSFLSFLWFPFFLFLLTFFFYLYAPFALNLDFELLTKNRIVYLSSFFPSLVNLIPNDNSNSRQKVDGLCQMLLSAASPSTTANSTHESDLMSPPMTPKHLNNSDTTIDQPHDHVLDDDIAPWVPFANHDGACPPSRKASLPHSTRAIKLVNCDTLDTIGRRFSMPFKRRPLPSSSIPHHRQPSPLRRKSVPKRSPSLAPTSDPACGFFTLNVFDRPRQASLSIDSPSRLETQPTATTPPSPSLSPSTVPLPFPCTTSLPSPPDCHLPTKPKPDTFFYDHVDLSVDDRAVYDPFWLPTWEPFDNKPAVRVTWKGTTSVYRPAYVRTHFILFLSDQALPSPSVLSPITTPFIRTNRPLPRLYDWPLNNTCDVNGQWSYLLMCSTSMVCLLGNRMRKRSVALMLTKQAAFGVLSIVWDGSILDDYVHSLFPPFPFPFVTLFYIKVYRIKSCFTPPLCFKVDGMPIILLLCILGPVNQRIVFCHPTTYWRENGSTWPTLKEASREHGVTDLVDLLRLLVISVGSPITAIQLNPIIHPPLIH